MSRQNFAANQNVVYRDFAATFSEPCVEQISQQILQQTNNYPVVSFGTSTWYTQLETDTIIIYIYINFDQIKLSSIEIKTYFIDLLMNKERFYLDDQ
jgi:hypothetical protein